MLGGKEESKKNGLTEPCASVLLSCRNYTLQKKLLE